MFNKNINKNINNNIVRNEEGARVYKRRIDQDLFLKALSMTPKNSFYATEKEKLNQIIELIQKNDKNYVEALAWFLGKVLGLRLSPTIIATELSTNKSVNWKSIEKIVKDVFTRPDFLANSVGYIKYKFNCKSFLDKTPKQLKMILKKQLETFSEKTLKGQKMKRRAIKLADLIKTLRPRNATLSPLYKAIIENDKAASLQVEIKDGKIKSAEHITAAISSDKVSHSEKREFVQKNIHEIPVNAILKNLTFLKKEDAPILKEKLEKVFQSKNGLRFINPFDLILIEGSNSRYTLELDDRIPQEIFDVLDEILKKYVQVEVECKNPLILYDCSGSMGGENHRRGLKFISSLGKIFQKEFQFYTFNMNWNQRTDQIRNIYNESNGPNKVAKKLFKFITCNGGTALHVAMKDVLEINPETDLFIIVTDEVTWADPKELEAYRRILPEKLFGKTILFNTDPGIGSILKPSADIIRLAGLNGKILSMIKAISNFDSFKQQIIEEFNS